MSCNIIRTYVPVRENKSLRGVTMQKVVVQSMCGIIFAVHQKFVEWGWIKPIEEIIEIRLLFRRSRFYVWDDIYYRYVEV